MDSDKISTFTTAGGAGVGQAAGAQQGEMMLSVMGEEGGAGAAARMRPPRATVPAAVVRTERRVGLTGMGVPRGWCFGVSLKRRDRAHKPLASRPA